MGERPVMTLPDFKKMLPLHVHDYERSGRRLAGMDPAASAPLILLLGIAHSGLCRGNSACSIPPP